MSAMDGTPHYNEAQEAESRAAMPLDFEGGTVLSMTWLPGPDYYDEPNRIERGEVDSEKWTIIGASDGHA